MLRCRARGRYGIIGEHGSDNDITAFNERRLRRRPEESGHSMIVEDKDVQNDVLRPNKGLHNTLSLPHNSEVRACIAVDALFPPPLSSLQVPPQMRGGGRRRGQERQS